MVRHGTRFYGSREVRFFDLFRSCSVCLSPTIADRRRLSPTASDLSPIVSDSLRLVSDSLRQPPMCLRQPPTCLRLSPTTCSRSSPTASDRLRQPPTCLRSPSTCLRLSPTASDVSPIVSDSLRRVSDRSLRLVCDRFQQPTTHRLRQPPTCIRSSPTASDVPPAVFDMQLSPIVSDSLRLVVDRFPTITDLSPIVTEHAKCRGWFAKVVSYYHTSHPTLLCN